MRRPLRAISEAEVEAFHRDGAVLVKQILGPEWVDCAEAGLDAAVARPGALAGKVGSRLHVDQFPAAHEPALRRLVEESPVAEIVGRALRSPVRFYMDQLFCKPAGPSSPRRGTRTPATTTSTATI